MPAHGLTVAQNQVLHLVKACPRPEGLNFEDLRNQLQRMTVASSKQAVDILSKERYVCSTVDADHFKPTDAEKLYLTGGLRYPSAGPIFTSLRLCICVTN
ncbi:hypothetical protein J1605_016289 [Eschrichtius robustus]|uniref:Replication protein A C-terminal domain-containing protein n=1 Tax=Eschrichtius robustus TaxID=9764 RepID=A0AB34G7S0_ESCRO|nr:hypothetical protein J1605_016289 [Eschrichtius robustus]